MSLLISAFLALSTSLLYLTSFLQTIPKHQMLCGTMYATSTCNMLNCVSQLHPPPLHPPSPPPPPSQRQQNKTPFKDHFDTDTAMKEEEEELSTIAMQPVIPTSRPHCIDILWWALWSTIRDTFHTSSFFNTAYQTSGKWKMKRHSYPSTFFGEDNCNARHVLLISIIGWKHLQRPSLNLPLFLTHNFIREPAEIQATKRHRYMPEIAPTVNCPQGILRWGLGGSWWMCWRTERDKPSDKRPIVNLESTVMHGVLTCSGDIESLGKTLTRNWT